LFPTTPEKEKTMARGNIKTEMKGTGGGRWDTRENAKRNANKARREADKKAVTPESYEGRKADFIAGFTAWVNFDADDESKSNLWQSGFAEAAAMNERGGNRPTSEDAPDAWGDFVTR
jgi:hypothetical protein